MKPPIGMTITLGTSEDGRTIPAAVTVTPAYCPCGWTCHETPNPCSISCLAHHPIDTTEEVQS